MENTKNAARKGTPWAMVMTVALIIAKLGFGVNIGWLWVFAPIWLPIVLLLAILILAGGIYLIAVLVIWLFTELPGWIARSRRQPSFA